MLRLALTSQMKWKQCAERLTAVGNGEGRNVRFVPIVKQIL